MLVATGISIEIDINGFKAQSFNIEGWDKVARGQVVVLRELRENKHVQVHYGILLTESHLVIAMAILFIASVNVLRKTTCKGSFVPAIVRQGPFHMSWKLSDDVHQTMALTMVCSATYRNFLTACIHCNSTLLPVISVILIKIQGDAAHSNMPQASMTSGTRAPMTRAMLLNLHEVLLQLSSWYLVIHGGSWKIQGSGSSWQPRSPPWFLSSSLQLLLRWTVLLPCCRQTWPGQNRKFSGTLDAEFQAHFSPILAR